MTKQYAISSPPSSTPRSVPRPQGRRRGDDADEVAGRPKITERTVVQTGCAQFVGGFEDFQSSAVVERLKRHEAAALIHNRCLTCLSGMKNYRTELDLNFQAVARLNLDDQDEREFGSFFEPSFEPKDEEVVLQLELRNGVFGTSRAKAGTAQGLILRAPWAWELHAPGINSSRGPSPIWGSATPSTRTSTPSPSPYSKVSPEPWTDVRLVGDSPHALLIDLQDRIPETLVLRRTRPKILEGASKPPFLPSLEDVPSRHEQSTMSSGSTAALKASLDRIEKQAVAHLEEACRHLTDETIETAMEDIKERLLNDPASVSFEDVKATTSGGITDFIRDFRSALRLVGSTMPAAARVLEVSLKGLVLAMTYEKVSGQKINDEMKAQLQKLQGASADAENARQQLAEAKKEGTTLAGKDCTD